jgi:hypothetical protein
MEITLNLRKLALGIGIGWLILVLGLVGHSVTPVLSDKPQVLTPERWEAAALARRASAEITRLQADGEALRAAAAKEPPDAVEAMLLAQRIYAGQREGTAATAGARTAIVDGAAAVARYAGGGLARQAAIDAVNAALVRITALIGQPASERVPFEKQDGHVVFLPVASAHPAAGEPDGVRARRPANR